MRLGLGRRIAFTLGALLIYCIGTYIPIPGIDPPAWEYFFRDHPDLVFSAFPGDFEPLLKSVHRSAETDL
jgi:preprotein translocase subunit SecY